MADLLAQSPNGQTFTVDVKGQSTRNFWLVQRREPSSSHFFVLVSIPPEFEPPRYFILSSAELMKHRADYEAASKARGKYKDNLGGMNWSTALPHENQWNVLPK